MNIMDIINKRDQIPETLRLIENPQQLTKPGNLWFLFDSNLSRKVWVPRRPDKRGRNEMAEIDSDFYEEQRKKQKGRWIIRVQRTKGRYE